MAFNTSVFKTRALTAIIFVVVMCAGIFINFWSFVLLCIIIGIGCSWEANKLAFVYGFENPDIKSPYNGIYAALLNGSVFFLILFDILFKDASTTFNLPIYISIALCLNAALLLIVFRQKLLYFRSITPLNKKTKAMLLDKYGLLAMISMAFLIRIRFEYGIALACIVIFSMWINDTMAYLVGSFIGKTPFSKISPKKTWEGTIGGIILCIVTVGGGAPLITTFPIASIHIFIIAGICAIAGTYGDLLESKIKRMAGVKDSGSFMPGHGGFMDRFDSLIFGVPFVWLYLLIINL